MTTIAGGGSTLTQQLYQRLFDRLNTDGNEALGQDEVGAAGLGADDAAKVFKALDADGDGRVMRAEMTPSDAFGAQVLSALIDVQSGSDSMTDQAFVAGLMERADTDRDGALSETELEAEADLRRAASYDAGYFAGRAVMIRDADGDGLVRPDEVSVVTVKRLSATLTDHVGDVEEAPVAQRELIDTIRERNGQPPLTWPQTDEERRLRREQLAADRAERDAAPEGTVGFLSRDLDGLRAGESARIAAEGVTDALAARLLGQILQGWKAPDVPGTSADMTA